MKICVYCGAEIENDTARCPYCGYINEEGAGINFRLILMRSADTINQQKFHITLENDEPVITAKNVPLAKIDLGIVKYNFEAASGHKCR